MFELPKISFDYKDFEPVVDAKTMEIHYAKHHQAYVDNLNKLVGGAVDQWIRDTDLETLLKKVDDLPEEIRQGVVNNAGGHWNHTFWWEQLAKPTEVNEPSKPVMERICDSFSTFDMFKEAFLKASLGRFGSGWVWVIKNKDGKLTIESTGNQDCPIMSGKVPVLGLDVWEHAYYLNYQNRRADYVNAFWKILDWKVVESRL